MSNSNVEAALAVMVVMMAVIIGQLRSIGPNLEAIWKTLRDIKESKR